MKSKKSYTFKSYYLILAGAVLKIWVSGFRHNLGCAPYDQSWVFFQNCQNTAFLLLYYSACKTATSMAFIWGDRGCPAVRFEYKTASERYLVAELWAQQFWVFFEKIETLNFFRKHPKLFCLYLSSQILLRGHFVLETNSRTSSITSYKNNCCSFYTSWVIKQYKCWFS